MSLAFFVPCVPPKGMAQQKGVMVIGGKPRFFKKAKIKQAENTWHDLLYSHAPFEPLQGPLCLVVRLVYPWRKGENKKRRAAFQFYPIETRPDIDNIFKMIADVMSTLRFWNDDSQIASLSLSKSYGDKTGIGITLTSALATTNEGHVATP